MSKWGRQRARHIEVGSLGVAIGQASSLTRCLVHSTGTLPAPFALLWFAITPHNPAHRYKSASVR
jgi:hypothetical protein